MYNNKELNWLIKMTKICPNCGRINPDKAKFCVYCGTKLPDTPTTAPQAPSTLISPTQTPELPPSVEPIGTISPPGSADFQTELIALRQELLMIKSRDPLTWLLIVIFGTLGIFVLLFAVILGLSLISTPSPGTVVISIPIIALSLAAILLPVIVTMYWYYKMSWELNFHNKHTVRLHNAELNYLSTQGINPQEIYLPPLNIEEFSPALRTFLLLIPIANIIVLYFLARDIKNHIEHHKAYYTNLAMALVRHGKAQEGQMIQYKVSKMDNIDTTLVVILLILLSTIGVLYTLYKAQSVLNAMWDLHMTTINTLLGSPATIA